MSQLKTSTGLGTARALITAASSALALSTLAAGVVLHGGQAQAASCDSSMLVGHVDCTVNGFTTIASIVDGSALAATDKVDYEKTGLVYPNSQFQIDTDLNPSYTGSAKTVVYKVEGVDSTLINGVDLSASCILTCNIQKQVYSDAALTNLVTTLSLTGSGFVNTVDLPAASVYYFKDTFDPNGGAVDNFQNTVRTPGPLPLLGAGAAFGFSRRLRGRIKASRTA